MAAAAEGSDSGSSCSSSEESEVFEIVLPITVIELSDDDFLESEDEEHTALKENGCLIAQAIEDRRIDNEDENHLSGGDLKSSNGKGHDISFEAVTVKEDAKGVPGSCENQNSVQMALLQNIQDNIDHGQNLIVDSLGYVTCDVTLNEFVKENHYEIEHNYFQKKVASCLNTRKKGEDELIVGGAAHLNSRFNEDMKRPRKNGELQENVLLGEKCEEDQNVVDEDNLMDSPSVEKDGSPDHFPLDAGDCANLPLHAACHLIQPLIADCPEECVIEEDCNSFYKDIERSQQLQMEQPQKMLMAMLGNKPKSKTPLIIAMEQYAKRKGARKCLFCNFRYTSSVYLRKHINAIHKGKTRYSCSFCCRTFFFSASLRHQHHELHMKMASLKKRKNNKPKTKGNKKTKDRIALKKRGKKKAMPKLLKCPQCAFTTNTVDHLKVHFGIHVGEKPFRCQECGKSFRRSSHLKRHNLTHMRKHHKCNHCFFMGSTVEELAVHQETCNNEDPTKRQLQSSASRCAITKVQAHVAEQNVNTATSQDVHGQMYKCEQCGYATHVLARLKHHRRVHTGERPYSCDVCEKKFRWSSHLKRHKFLHHNLDLREKSHTNGRKPESPSSWEWGIPRPVSKTFICDYCNLIFHREEHLQYHKPIHLPAPSHERMANGELEGGTTLSVEQPSQGSALKLFKCHECVYTTNSFSNLQVHFSVHTGEKPFQCRECDKSFRTSSHLKRHSVLHWWKPHKCKRCHFISSTVEELELHQEECTSEDPKRRRRGSSSALGGDIAKKHKNKANGNKSTRKSQEVDLKAFQCELCDYVTSKSSHLKHHKSRHHRLELKCGSCDFSTGNGQCFKKHMASHTNAKPPLYDHTQKQPPLFVKVYKCEECDYVTDRNGNLKIHLRIHTDERPHKCSHCSHAFRTSSHLNRHLATHLKLQCPKCTFSAANKRALEKHAQIHKAKTSRKSHKEKKNS